MNIPQNKKFGKKQQPFNSLLQIENGKKIPLFDLFQASDFKVRLNQDHYSEDSVFFRDRDRSVTIPSLEILKRP